jgi:hypothetical protein
MRFVGERRALAAAVLAFFMLQFLLTGLLVDSPFRLMLIGLGLVYGTAFFGVVAGYFWARWYALGLAFSGVAMAVMTVLRGGEVGMVVYLIGGTHAAIAFGLLGVDAAAFYDGRRDWRERLKMDENSVNRLGKAITRAGASLPYLIIAGLAPRESEMLGALALGLGVIGLTGVVRMRTWGLLGLAGAAVASLAALSQGAPWLASAANADAPLIIAPPLLAAALLAAAVAPWVRPAVRHLRSH